MQVIVSDSTHCGAHNRDGSLCRQPAGFRTEHVGEGKCYLHGGLTPRGPDSANWKHGRSSRYAETVRGEISERMQALADYDAHDIADELLLQRALLASFLDKGTLNPQEQSLAMQWLSEISKTAERMTRMRNDTAITAAEVKLISARLADVVTRYITDPEEQARFMAEVFSIGIGG